MNKRYLLPLNLQLFAEDTDVDPEEFEIDDAGDDSFEIDENEFEIEDDEDSDETDADDSEEEDEQDPQEEQLNTKEPKNETASAVIAERKRLQEKHRKEIDALSKQAAIAQKLMAQAGVADLEEFSRRVDALEAQKLQQQGMSPEMAQAFVTMQRQTTELQSTMRKQKYESEATLLKADPFFADIDDYRDEFEQIAERTGMTLEEVYMSKRGKQRMKEREAEIEMRVKHNQQKKASKKVDATGSAAAKQTSKVNLTPEQLQMARYAGIDPKEYAKYLKK